MATNQARNNMNKFIKAVKVSILRVIYLFGYTVNKLPHKSKKTSDVVEMIVAGKKIKVHSGNPLRSVYTENPQCNIHMAQVAALVEEKYPAAWAVDVGANVGDTLAIIRSRTKMPIICVEGDSHCFELLQENAHQFENAHMFNMFLSNQPGSAFIKTEKEGWNATLSECQNQENSREIEFETLDRLADRLKCQAMVKLLKVDTEGYDMRILRGAAAILATTHPVLSLEMNKENIKPLGDDVGAFFEYLTGLGYCNFFLIDPTGRPVCVLDANDHKPFLSLYDFSGPAQCLCYLDIWAFHHADQDLFVNFLTGYRLSISV
jgi:FkbM family methyltransferase